MEIPLTPMEFARRARRLYAGREAVIDGELRLNYEQFFDRCDRWSACLQRMGVRQYDRVAYISPNTRSQLESFYAVPQIGAVVVPVNYRLIPDEFAYIINHSGSRIVCAHADDIRESCMETNASNQSMKPTAHFDITPACLLRPLPWLISISLDDEAASSRTLE